jgi:hypothetical protein
MIFLKKFLPANKFLPDRHPASAGFFCAMLFVLGTFEPKLKKDYFLIFKTNCLYAYIMVAGGVDGAAPHGFTLSKKAAR